MTKALAGVILDPKAGDRFAFTESATLVANQDGVRMIFPDGHEIDLGEPVEEMKLILVSPQRLFFTSRD